jgi:hypothetical protein
MWKLFSEAIMWNYYFVHGIGTVHMDWAFSYVKSWESFPEQHHRINITTSSCIPLHQFMITFENIVMTGFAISSYYISSRCVVSFSYCEVVRMKFEVPLQGGFRLETYHFKSGFNWIIVFARTFPIVSIQLQTNNVYSRYRAFFENERKSKGPRRSVFDTDDDACLIRMVMLKLLKLISLFQKY